jgi:hypothetical protein
MEPAPCAHTVRHVRHERRRGMFNWTALGKAMLLATLALVAAVGGFEGWTWR